MSEIVGLHPLAEAPPLFAGLAGDISVSFEFFPPKTDVASHQLWAAIDSLAACAPAFVSVTYGAGGTTRDRTIATVERIQTGTQLPVASHLTCVDASKNQVNSVAERLWELGVR